MGNVCFRIVKGSEQVGYRPICDECGSTDKDALFIVAVIPVGCDNGDNTVCLSCFVKHVDGAEEFARALLEKKWKAKIPRPAVDDAEREAMTTSGPKCYAVHPEQAFMCTRAKGHPEDSDHISAARVIVARWPAKSKPKLRLVKEGEPPKGEGDG